MAKATKQRVLILCTGNSARSQLAEGWLRALGGPEVRAAEVGDRNQGHLRHAVGISRITAASRS